MEIYSVEHTTQIIKVIIGEASDEIYEALEKIEAILETFHSKAVNYLAVDSLFYQVGVHVTTAYMKLGGSQEVNIAELFEPALAGINSAMLMFHGCFEKWKSPRPCGSCEPPGLTQHAVRAIVIELEGAKYNLSIASEMIFDRLNGLIDVLREAEIRILTDNTA